MGHTNSTTYYNLPQFVTSDKPAWLTDINNAMSDIDTGIHAAQADATTAGSNASQALLDASAASTAASAADAKGAGACASIEAAFDSTTIYAVGAKVMYNSLLYRCTVAVTTPGPWTGSANWERITVNSIIPTTAGNLPLGSDFTDPDSTAYAIKALETALIINGVTPTAKTSAQTGGYIKIGNIVIVSFDFTLAQAATQGESLCEGFPIPAVSDTPIAMFQNSYPPVATSIGARIYNGGLYSNTALSSTNLKYHAFGIYYALN